MSQDNPQIRPTIEAVPCGRNGNAILTVRHDNEIIEYRKVDLSKPTAREQFIQALAEKLPNIDVKAIDSELLKIGASLVVEPAGVPESTSDLDSQELLAQM